MSKEKSYAPVIRENLEPNNPYERYLVAEGARYIWMAEAIYPWSLLDRDPGCSRGSNAQTETGSDHRGRALLLIAPISKIAEEDMVYVQYKQGIAETPYAIVFDHAWNSIIVTIRGTQSLEDLLADLNMLPTELKELGEECGFDGSDRFCHSGVLACTEWIYRDLER
jgi:hypothetical protein